MGMKTLTEVAVGTQTRSRPATSAKDSDFDAFVRSAGPGLKRYAFLLTGNRAQAEDLLQESLVKMYLAWERLEDTRSLTAYARTVIARQHVSFWRKSRREMPVEMIGALTDAWTDEHYDDRDRVWKMLTGVSRQQRAALVLRYYEGLSDAEIADTLGCAVGTVRGHISRGLERLRVSMAAAQEGERA